MSDVKLTDGFLNFSAELTGFSVFELRATGEADAYLDAAVDVVGQQVLQALVAAYENLSVTGEERADQLKRDILDDQKLGSVARNIIKMWFSGVWYQLPQSWVSEYGTGADNSAFTVRPSSFPEGLLWKTIGANPPGARAPGYASWAEPPRIPDPEQGFSLLKIQS